MRDSLLFARIPRRIPVRTVAALVVAALAVVLVQTQLAGRSPTGATAATTGVTPNASGALDCNGLSPIQRQIRHDPA